MESIGGATFVFPHPDGASGEADRGPVIFGPAEAGGAYMAMVGAMAAGDAEHITQPVDIA